MREGANINNVNAIFSSSGNCPPAVAKRQLWRAGRIGEDGELVVESIKTKKLKTEEGITTRDKSTGEYYCVFVDQGVTKTEPGECGSILNSNNQNTNETASSTATTTNP